MSSTSSTSSIPISGRTRFTVAIDLAKHTHVATIFDTHKLHPCEVIKVPVTARGFTHFQTRLEHYSHDPRDFIIGCEATGHYGETLLKRLQSLGYAIVRLNPTQVVQFRRGLGVRAKTDELDAIAMARQLSVMDVTPDMTLSEPAERLRRLTRLRLDFVEEQSRWINRARALLNQICPELEPIFKDFTSPSTLAFLLAFPSRTAIAHASVEELSSVARRSSHGVRGVKFAKQLQTAAQQSIGLDDPWLAEELQIVLQQLAHVVTVVKQLEAQIATRTKDYLHQQSQVRGFQQPLTPSAFPVKGTLALGTLLGEIGSVDRFESMRHLLSFFGWCPQTTESGTMSNPHPAMSPKGNRFARRIIFLQAVVAIRWLPEYRTYFAERTRSGKKKMKTLIAVGRKLLSVIVAVLRTGQPYEPDRYLTYTQAKPVMNASPTPAGA
jgi:transposase